MIKAHFHANDVVFSISVCLTVCLSVSRMSVGEVGTKNMYVLYTNVIKQLQKKECSQILLKHVFSL